MVLVKVVRMMGLVVVVSVIRMMGLVFVVSVVKWPHIMVIKCTRLYNPGAYSLVSILPKGFSY